LILGLANSLLKRPDILVSLSNAFEIAFLPLSWFQGVPEFARQARCLYAKLAHAIATGSSKKAYLIPAWLLIPDRITAGANLQEAILDMQTKSDKLNQLFDHLINLERFGSPDQHEKINKKKKEMIETAVREAEVSISRWC
jgi:hypothetical protein